MGHTLYCWDMIEMGKICVCEQCGHRWLGDEPKRCSKCKSSRWNEAGVSLAKTAPEEENAGSRPEPKKSEKIQKVAAVEIDAKEPPVKSSTEVKYSSGSRGTKCPECGCELNDHRRNGCGNWGCKCKLDQDAAYKLLMS